MVFYWMHKCIKYNLKRCVLCEMFEIPHKRNLCYSLTIVNRAVQPACIALRVVSKIQIKRDDFL